jgi:hypothetical protein
VVGAALRLLEEEMDEKDLTGIVAHVKDEMHRPE